MRPAPIQVNYLGYPGTMGADFIDYIVADSFIIPREHEGDYAEKVVRLPGSYQVNDRARKIGATPSRRELGLPETGFVFCTFNQAYKILPETFAVWMRLLAAVPGSILWVLESNAAALANMRRQSAAQGIDPARLVSAPLAPPEQHLGRMRAADLFLDTWPYNAHTSASDALWSGLPVVTYAGDTFASRVAGSLLRALGVPELVADSVQGYERVALQLASRPLEMAAMRRKVEACRDTGALFDTPGFTRSLETAYAAMWERYSAGQAPAAINIEASAAGQPPSNV